MPIIREYDQRLNAPNRPLSQPADPGAAARAGDGLKALSGALATVSRTAFDIAEQSEMTSLQVETARARAEFAERMQRAKETGEAADPEYVKSVADAAQEAAAKLADGKATRRGAEAARMYGAQFAAGMQMQAIGDNAAAIGEQAKLTALEAQNINRNTLRSSPQQFEAILGETLAHLDGPAYAHVDAGLRARLKQEAKAGLALSAIEGVINTRSPEEAKQLLDSGWADGFLNANDKRALYAEVEQSIRAREAEAIRLERQQRLLDEKEREVTKDKFVGLMHTPNGNQLSVKAILASNLLSAEKEHFINALKEGAAAKANPAVVNQLFHRMYLPDGDPNKISDTAQLVPYVGKGIDLTALDHLSRELKNTPAGQNYSRAAASAYQMFRGSKVGQALPDVAEAAFIDWRADLSAAMEKYRAEGKDTNELLSRDPNNTDSFLHPAKMSAYIKPANILTAEQAMRKGAPAPGDVEQHGNAKYKFKGGNPADESSWELVP